MARIDHSSHNHPNTAAARKVCRDEIRETDARIDAYYGTNPLGPDPRLAIVVPPIEKEIARSQANQRARRAMDRRIQPKRSGARVSSRGSSCVQAALHIDAHGGRCACGWVAAKIS